MKTGLYVDSVTSTPLDGDYVVTTESDTKIGGRAQLSNESYADGVPVKEWVYIYGGDTIHTGRYLEEPKLKGELATAASAQRVDLNLWQEGGYQLYHFLSIQIINPKRLDSTSIERVYQTALAPLKGKYQFRTLFLDRITDSERVEVKKVDLQ